MHAINNLFYFSEKKEYSEIEGGMDGFSYRRLEEGKELEMEETYRKGVVDLPLET